MKPWDITTFDGKSIPEKDTYTLQEFASLYNSVSVEDLKKINKKYNLIKTFYDGKTDQLLIKKKEFLQAKDWCDFTWSELNQKEYAEPNWLQFLKFLVGSVFTIAAFFPGIVIVQSHYSLKNSDYGWIIIIFIALIPGVFLFYIYEKIFGDDSELMKVMKPLLWKFRKYAYKG